MNVTSEYFLPLYYATPLQLDDTRFTPTYIQYLAPPATSYLFFSSNADQTWLAYGFKIRVFNPMTARQLKQSGKTRPNLSN
jgi:hypothetical protein